jgi:hypothetical protein
MTKTITKQRDYLQSKIKRICHYGGVAEKPEGDEQGDSSEGAETAGALT